MVEHGHDVIAWTRRTADLRSPAAVRDKLVGGGALDGVVHLAAVATVRESWAEPLRYFDTNAGGTSNLLAALAGRQVPVVFASTAAVYGSKAVGALSEDLPAAPDNPYAASKWAAEQLLSYQARTGAIGSTVLRLFNVAGALPGITDPNTTRIIAACLRCAAGEIEYVTVNGDGSAMREFTHVADVAEAIRLALASTSVGEARTFNVGTGVGVSMADVIDVAREVTGHPIPVKHNPPANEPQVLVSDPSRAGQVLGWKPQRSAIETVISDAWAEKR